MHLFMFVLHFVNAKEHVDEYICVGKFPGKLCLMYTTGAVTGPLNANT